MGNIKDIVDLAMRLESRVKDRKDIETLRSIISLTQAVQSSNAEVVERDIRVMQENAKLVQEKSELERQLEAAKAEDIRFAHGVEFHKSKKTGGDWMAFCPVCHIPAVESDPGVISCSGCAWAGAEIPNSLEFVIRQLGGRDA